MRLQRLGFWLCALPVLAGSACEESPVIGEREEVVNRFVDIRNVMVAGQGWLTFKVDIPGDAIHPHIEGRWTVGNVERPVDVYVFRGSQYDPNLSPVAQPQPYFWTSTIAAGSGIGQNRTNEVHIHASSGQWVVVFYNPGANPLTSRTDLSAEIENNYFR